MASNQPSAVLMTEGSISRHIIRFALPLVLGNLFQQFYNTADTLIVGRFISDQALAAVSSSGSLVFLLVSFFNGVAIGAGVVISRYFGAKDTRRMRLAVHTALAFGVVEGIVATIIGVLLTPHILVWMGTPDSVLPESIAYLRVYFAGALGMILYNACMGIMQAVGDSRHPLMYLIISSVLNIVLDLVFIGVLGFGVEGAAIATIISQFTSVALCLIRLFRVDEDYRINLSELRLHLPTLKLILRYGLPTGLQNSIVSISNVVVQANVNSFGEIAMAGCGSYSKVEGFAFLPMMCYNSAVTTFVSQNLGAKQYERTRKGAAFGILCSMATAEIIGIIFFAFAPTIIGLFTTNAEAIAYGVARARASTLLYFLPALTHALSATLRGAGRPMVPVFSMLAFWCALRVGFLTITESICHSIVFVNWVYPLTWVASSIFLLLYFKHVDWLGRGDSL